MSTHGNKATVGRYFDSAVNPLILEDTMSVTNQLGNNIRSLRKAYGETQEQLGEVLHIEKNTVSSYEKGVREPSKETVRAIAKHYMISMEELLHSDYTTIGKIRFDKDAFWKNIDIILPIASSAKALENFHFSRAYKAHKAFFEELRKVSLDKIDNVDICMDEYSEALDCDETKAEAAANMIGLWYLLLAGLKVAPAVMRDVPAPLKQIGKRDNKVQKMIDNPDPSFQTEAEEILTEISDDESEEIVSELLTTIKESNAWSDLGDYYLALQYVWNLVDNGLDWGFNQRIGIEMLNAYVSVNNVYAARYLKFCLDSVTSESSRSVDD